MLDYAQLPAGEPADRVAVMVTFLQMALPVMGDKAVEFPPGATLAKRRLSIAAYRRLYADIGGQWLWWLRRVMPNDLLVQHLADPAVATYVLTIDDKPAGFFELDAGHLPNVNINYFGLMPDMIGRGLGMKLLQAAINEASLIRAPVPARRLTVNTCTADHPRALPNYLAAGFHEVRRAREIWDIPRRLGLRIPDHLRA